MQVYWELLRPFLGTETLSSPAISTFQTPAGPKESQSHLGLTILWIPSTPDLAGIEERINTSHKTMKAQKISSQSLPKGIAM